MSYDPQVDTDYATLVGTDVNDNYNRAELIDFADNEYLVDLSTNEDWEIVTFIDYMEWLTQDGYTVNEAIDLAIANLGFELKVMVA